MKKSNVADAVNGIEILDNMEVPERQIRPSYPFGDLKPGQRQGRSLYCQAHT